ncbi:hypothetical protein ABZ135_34670 [Streptomyces sp. NPDC006339]|uniref:hypothetical protein n=1 Tax=Streptomyces sp. NPDC006339 TaxID=3156755 RepID=UPI0033B99CB1
MAWDEWEQLKAEVVAGRSEEHSPSMRLNQLPADPGGGAPAGGASEELKTEKRAWVKAGEGVSGLKADVAKALSALDCGQAGLGDTGGCQSAAAQKELYDSWKKYVGDVSGRCEALGGLLQTSGHDLSKPDQALVGELGGLTAKYADTAPVGGQAQGR